MIPTKTSSTLLSPQHDVQSNTTEQKVESCMSQMFCIDHLFIWLPFNSIEISPSLAYEWSEIMGSYTSLDPLVGREKVLTQLNAKFAM